MAYVGTSEQLANAIINNDVEYVREWCRNLSFDSRKLINERDYCGRTPLQLACMTDGTSLDVVQCLIDNGARLIARMQDGRTALHIAASLGRDDIVRALLKKSAANEAERDTRETKQRKQAPTEGDDVEMQDAETQGDVKADDNESDSDDSSGRHDFESIHMSEVATEDNFDSQRAHSDGFVDVQRPKTSETAQDIDEADAAAEEEDDIYDIDIEDWEYVFFSADDT
jgi:ankyrin repeat protein